MSTPTSREPDERPGDPAAGQHAAPRPAPPLPDGPPAAPLAGPRAPATTQASTPTSTSAGSDAAAHGAGGTAAPVAPAPQPDVERPPHPPVPPPASATAVLPVAAPGATSVQGEQSATRRGHAADRPLDEVEQQPRVVDQHVREVEERELPERPKKPGFGRHLLGALLGLLLTPVALLLTGIGTARLADVSGSGDPLTDALGLTLLVVGVLLLAVIVLLGAWSPAVPIVGGLVWGIGLGLAFLVVPEVMADTLEQMSADNVVPGGIEQLAESAQSGYLLVTGTLLVAAGIAAARARRRGRRFAEGVAAHDAAQVQVREGRRVA